jgi:hypothetical protein
MLPSVSRASHGGSSLHLVERLFDEGEWSRARWILEQRLREAPHDHWLHMQIAVSFFEDRRLVEAGSAVERAVVLAPECPSVLWYRGGILHELSRLEDAAHIYSAIVERGPERWMKGGCGLSIGRARGLVSDSWRRLVDIHQARGETKLSELAFDEHLSMLGPGCFGLYTLSVTSTASPETIRRNLRMRTSIRKTLAPAQIH